MQDPSLTWRDIEAARSRPGAARIVAIVLSLTVLTLPAAVLADVIGLRAIDLMMPG